MRAADGAVRGLRTRTPAGAKRAVRGSRDGLFLPADWADAPPDRPARLVIAEGPTDAAALLAWGFLAVVRKGAENLAAGVLPVVPAVRVCEPPADVKDARAWFLAGATADDVAARFDAAPARRLRIRRGGKGAGE